MKEYHLSTPQERTTGIAFSIAMAICFGILVFALRSNVPLMIFTGLAALLITVLLGFYVASVLKAVCVLDVEKKTMEVRGFPNYTVDLSNAILLQTLPRRSGHTSVRVLVFSDAEEHIIAAIPTLFTYKQGVLADPLAKQIAQDMGIDFQQNVPEWEYDKEKYKEHAKQVAEEERAASKARRESKMKARIEKARKR